MSYAPLAPAEDADFEQVIEYYTQVLDDLHAQLERTVSLSSIRSFALTDSDAFTLSALPLTSTAPDAISCCARLRVGAKALSTSSLSKR